MFFFSIYIVTSFEIYSDIIKMAVASEVQKSSYNTGTKQPQHFVQVYNVGLLMTSQKPLLC